MFIKTVSTSTGINPIKFDETGGVFYWILNTGSSTVYASTNATFTAGDDGVVSLGPKESRRLETNNDTIYILGEGQAEIHNQRDGICSFKQAPTSSGSGGGGTVDAYTKTESDAKYAQKTDIPTTLPANGGNADTVGGKSIDEIFFSAIYLNAIHDIDNTDGNWSLGVVSTVTEEISGTFPPNCPAWTVINQYQTSISKDFKIQTCQSVADNTRLWIRSKWVGSAVWNDWVDVYTGSNKPYVTGTFTVNASDTEQTISVPLTFNPSVVLLFTSQITLAVPKQIILIALSGTEYKIKIGVHNSGDLSALSTGFEAIINSWKGTASTIEYIAYE